MRLFYFTRPLCNLLSIFFSFIILLKIYALWKSVGINPFHAMGLYPLKSSENLCFQGVYEETTSMKWVKLFARGSQRKKLLLIFSLTLNVHSIKISGKLQNFRFYHAFLHISFYGICAFLQGVTCKSFLQ